MEVKVLVTYASTYGSTREVAEVVTATLRGHGLTVDLQPARDVRTVEGYRAVVLGAPLYMFHLHKDALRFLGRHQAALAGLPVAVFAGGPFGEEAGANAGGKEWQEVRKNLEQELAKFPWLKPVAVEVIGGRFDPARLRSPGIWFPRSGGCRPATCAIGTRSAAGRARWPGSFSPLWRSEGTRGTNKALTQRLSNTLRSLGRHSVPAAFRPYAAFVHDSLQALSQHNNVVGYRRKSDHCISARTAR